VDDHSDDATRRARARKAAEECRAAQRIAIHSAGNLPPRLDREKLWALNEGIQLAASQSPEIPFWFHGRRYRARAGHIAPSRFPRWREIRSTLASLMVLLQAKTFPEIASDSAISLFFSDALSAPMDRGTPTQAQPELRADVFYCGENVLAPIRGAPPRFAVVK